MKENKKEIREKFLGFGRQEFADWLEKGLIEIYPGKAQNDSVRMRGSFEGMGGEILSKETITEGVAQIYEDYVPESSKLPFRQAIGDVLREPNPEKMVSAEAVEDLIYLTSRIKAYEVLESFVPVIERKDVGPEEMLFPMIGVLKLMSPSDEVYKTTRELIDSLNFDEGYLFEALNIISKCSSADTLPALNEFLPRLEKLKSECRELGNDDWAAYKEAAAAFSSDVFNRAPEDQKAEVKKILDELNS
jgi:hypothetical protein